MVALKRTIDKKIYLAAPLFSAEFFAACMALQAICFATFRGFGRDASLRSRFERRREARPNDWNSEWDACFSNEASEPTLIHEAYQRVVRAFSTDIGVRQDGGWSQ